MKIFRIALQANAVKIVIAQSTSNELSLKANEQDLNLVNSIYHKSLNLGLELLDNILISNSSITSEKPLFYSYLEHGLIKLIEQDITYRTVDEVREALDQEKKDYSYDKVKNAKKEIAKKMLLKNKPIEEIIEFTGLTMESVNKIKTRLFSTDTTE